MIGKRVVFAYGRDNDRVEKNGTVIDKVRATDRLTDEAGNVQFVSSHDIYLIEEGDGSVSSIHPFHVIKIVKDGSN